MNGQKTVAGTTPEDVMRYNSNNVELRRLRLRVQAVARIVHDATRDTLKARCFVQNAGTLELSPEQQAIEDLCARIAGALQTEPACEHDGDPRFGMITNEAYGIELFPDQPTCQDDS